MYPHERSLVHSLCILAVFELGQYWIRVDEGLLQLGIDDGLCFLEDVGTIVGSQILF